MPNKTKAQNGNPVSVSTIHPNKQYRNQRGPDEAQAPFVSRRNGLRVQNFLEMLCMIVLVVEKGC